LDRDGTINVKAPEGGYITSPGDLELLPGAAAAVRALNRAGVPVFVVTNQRGVALGRMSAADVGAVNARLEDLLALEGARVDAIYVCPHEGGTCGCRKPLPGLLLRAAADHPGTVLGSAVLVGDAESDVGAALAAGVTAVRLGAPGVTTKAAWVAPDLAAAVGRILGGGPGGDPGAPPGPAAGSGPGGAG
jgi:D-glycero-D-manno-heptose 1,7-bisphosphate phosphatase